MMVPKRCYEILHGNQIKWLNFTPTGRYLYTRQEKEAHVSWLAAVCQGVHMVTFHALSCSHSTNNILWTSQQVLIFNKNTSHWETWEGKERHNASTYHISGMLLIMKLVHNCARSEVQWYGLQACNVQGRALTPDLRTLMYHPGCKNPYSLHSVPFLCKSLVSLPCGLGTKCSPGQLRGSSHSANSIMPFGTISHFAIIVKEKNRGTNWVTHSFFLFMLSRLESWVEQYFLLSSHVFFSLLKR